MPFVAGKSGNPKGRPRNADAISERVFALVDRDAPQAIVDELKRLYDGDVPPMISILDAAILKQAWIAQNGNLDALRDILDRIYGKPVARAENENNHNFPTGLKLILGE